MTLKHVGAGKYLTWCGKKAGAQELTLAIDAHYALAQQRQ